MCNSSILDCLHIDYIIDDVPADGDCFYSAVCRQLGDTFTPSMLRELTAFNLNKEDVMLFNAVNDTNMSIERFKAETKKPHKIWADNVEINALSRGLSGICILIFDEETHTICKISSDKEEHRRKYVLIHRSDAHYRSVKVCDRAVCKIVHMLHGQTCKLVQTNHKSMNMLLVIVSLIIFVKFLDRSLQHW